MGGKENVWQNTYIVNHCSFGQSKTKVCAGMLQLYLIQSEQKCYSCVSKYCKYEVIVKQNEKYLVKVHTKVAPRKKSSTGRSLV